MAKYKDTYNGNNIQFNSVDTILSGNNKKWGQAELGGATDADLVDIASDNGGKLPTIVNAVEIDWNDASICNQTVSTTGQLLNIINELNNKVNLLTDNVGFDPNTIELTVPNNSSYHSYSTGVGYTLYGNNAYLNVSATLSYIYNNDEYNTSNKIVGWQLNPINFTTHDSYFTFVNSTISGNFNTIGLNMDAAALTYLTETLRIETFTFIAFSITNSLVSAPINIKIKDGRIGKFTTDITDIEVTDIDNGKNTYFTYGVIKVSNITHNCFAAPNVNISIDNNAYIKLVDPENIGPNGSIDDAYMVNNIELPSAGEKTIYCYTCLITHNDKTYPDSDITVPITISLVNNDSYSGIGMTQTTVSFYNSSTSDAPEPTPSSGEEDGEEAS
jgi:hypothetical protein